MPVRAELQPVFYRGGAEIRGGAGCVARRQTNLPLPSVEPRRIRSTVRNEHDSLQSPGPKTQDPITKMCPKTLILPDLGIDDQPITLSVWLVKRGARLKEGTPLTEVLCGGVTVDLPSPSDGILAEKLAAEDDVLSVGQKLAVIEEAF